jgi:hypothetical protein
MFSSIINVLKVFKFLLKKLEDVKLYIKNYLKPEYFSININFS